MSFLAPHWLWLLGAVAALAGLYAVLQWRRRGTYTVRFTNVELLDSVAPRRPGWRRHLVAGLFLVALGLLVVSLARPTRPEDAPLGPVVVLAIDTSLSMQATDVDPNRIEAAQEAADDLVAGLDRGVRVGLVGFDAVATVQVAPTTDHDSVRDAIAGLRLDESTAIGEAIFAGLDAIAIAEREQPEDPEDGEPTSRIVLMSDGETTVGRPDVDAARAAVEVGVPVSTIAFGTQGATIEIPGEGEVDVSVNEQALEAIAESTGGEFFTATTAGELADAFADVGGEVDQESVEREVGTWFLGLAVTLLLATALLSLRWFSRLP